MGSLELLLAALGSALPLLALFDALRHPEPAWKASGHSRSVWLGLFAAGILLSLTFFPGAIISLIYLLGVRPSLKSERKQPAD